MPVGNRLPEPVYVVGSTLAGDDHPVAVELTLHTRHRLEQMPDALDLMYATQKQHRVRLLPAGLHRHPSDVYSRGHHGDMVVEAQLPQMTRLAVGCGHQHIGAAQCPCLIEMQRGPLACPVMPVHNPRLEHAVGGERHGQMQRPRHTHYGSTGRHPATVDMHHLGRYRFEQRPDLSGPRPVPRPVGRQIVQRAVVYRQRVGRAVGEDVQLSLRAQRLGHELHVGGGATRALVDVGYVVDDDHDGLWDGVGVNGCGRPPYRRDTGQRGARRSLPWRRKDASCSTRRCAQRLHRTRGHARSH